MFRLVYRSQAVDDKNARDVADLIGASSVNNAAYGVTGVLLYQNGQFLHELNGARRAISRAFAGLRRDPRHGSIELLAFGPLDAALTLEGDPVRCPTTGAHQFAASILDALPPLTLG